jgi:transcriptional regulator with XRE-family HTH domain
MTLGQRLREIRKNQKLTQKQVALGTGKSERHYQDIEYGRVKPSYSYLLILADFFRLSLDAIVGRSVAEPLKTSDTNKIIPAEKRHLVYLSLLLDDKDARNEITKSLMEIDCFPAGMLYPCAISDDELRLIHQAVKECDYYLLVVGAAKIPEDALALPRAEFRFAMEHDKPRAVFAQCSGHGGESYLALSGLEITNPTDCMSWRSAEDLGDGVCRKISQLKKQRPSRGWMHGDEITKEQLLLEHELRVKIETLEKRVSETRSL